MIKRKKKICNYLVEGFKHKRTKIPTLEISSRSSKVVKWRNVIYVQHGITCWIPQLLLPKKYFVAFNVIILTYLYDSNPKLKKIVSSRKYKSDIYSNSWFTINLLFNLDFLDVLLTLIYARPTKIKSYSWTGVDSVSSLVIIDIFSFTILIVSPILRMSKISL